MEAVANAVREDWHEANERDALARQIAELKKGYRIKPPAPSLILSFLLDRGRAGILASVPRTILTFPVTKRGWRRGRSRSAL